MRPRAGNPRVDPATPDEVGPYRPALASRPVSGAGGAGAAVIGSRADPGGTVRHRTRLTTTVLVWLAWTALAAALLASHEMWRDELQAWSIARESSWPGEVLANLRWEGHPPTWHLLLWPFTRLTREPWMLQVVALAVGSAATWLVLRHLRLPLPIRGAVVFGYFPLFEMGTIARTYGLAYLLTVAFLALRQRRSTPGWALVALLAALAGTTVLAVPLTAGLALAHWGVPAITRRDRWRHAALHVGAVAAAAAGALALARPRGGGGPGIGGSEITTETGEQLLGGPLRAAFPVPPFEDRFWDRTWLGQELPDHRWLLGLLVIAVVVVAVRRSPAALVLWVVAVAGHLGMTAVGDLPTYLRQMTLLWISLLATAWVAADDLRRDRPPSDDHPADDAGSGRGREHPAVVAVVGLVALVALAGSLVAAAWAARTELRFPFSGAEAATAWIDGQVAGEPVVLCAVNRAVCSSVSVRLDVPAWVDPAEEPFAFVAWRPGWRRTLPAEELPAAAAELAALTGREVVVVAGHGSPPAGCADGFVAPASIMERVTVCRADQLVPGGEGA